MRIRLARRSELFVPLLLLLPALLGRTREVAALAAACALGRLCTLCGAEGFRRAAAGEVSSRRTSGAWTGALLATFLLIAVFGLAAPSVWAWLLAAPPPRDVWRSLWVIGATLPLARLADEDLRAAGQGETAALSAFLRALLLTGAAFCGLDWMAGAAALSAFVAMGMAAAVGRAILSAPNAAAIVRMPAATLRALLYPLSGLLLLAGFWRRGAQGALAGYLLGLGLLQCAATPFRRDRAESAPLRLLLAVPAAAMSALSPLGAQWMAAAALAVFAALIGLAVYAAPTPRLLPTALLLIAACLLALFRPALAAWAAPLCALLSLLPLLPDAREMLLRLRARRRRPKR